MTHLRRLLFVAPILVLVYLGTAGVASASTVKSSAPVAALQTSISNPVAPTPAQQGAAGQQSNFICGANNTTAGVVATNPQGSDPNSDPSNLLPIDRWGSVAGSDIHTELSTTLLDDITQRLQRDFIESGAISLGNTFWRAGTGLTRFATDFCFANSVGSYMNSFASAIGQSLEGPVAVILGFGLILLCWRAARGSGTPGKTLFRMLATASLFVVMIIGGSSSGSDPTGSPLWFITSVNNAAGDLASLPAATIAAQSDQLTGLQDQGGNQNGLSCGNYINYLLTSYSEDYGVNSPEAVVPMSLDAMWEQTGLRAAIDVQFGANNPYGSQVYCRLFEDEVGISPQDQLDDTTVANDTPTFTSNGTLNAGIPSSILNNVAKGDNITTSEAWNGNEDDSTSIDHSLIGWAECETNTTTWAIPQQWKDAVNPNSSATTNADCDKWWDSASSGSGSTDVFGWTSNSTDQINTATANTPQVADFILNFHGDANGQAFTTSITYLISSVVVFIVFAILAMAVIIAKVSLLIMGVLATVVLAIAMWPSADVGGRALAFAKHAFGLILFTVGTQVILSLVAIITGFIEDAGTAQFGTGTFLTILWMAFSPIAALIVVHHLFKHVVKAPSPFKLTSALAWGAAAGGAGAGVGAGLERLSGRSHRRAENLGRRAGQRITSRFGAPRGEAPRQRIGGMSGEGAPRGRAGAEASAQGGGQGGMVGSGAGRGQGGGSGGVAPAAADGLPKSRNRRMLEELRSVREGRKILRGGRIEAARTAQTARLANRAGRRFGLPDGVDAVARYGATLPVAAKAGGLRGALGRRAYSAAGATKQRVRVAADRFREKPVRNSLKVLGATAAAVALPVATVPALGAVAAAYGLHKARQARKERPAARLERRKTAISAYREQVEQKRTEAEDDLAIQHPVPAGEMEPTAKAPTDEEKTTNSTGGEEQAHPVPVWDDEDDPSPLPAAAAPLNGPEPDRSDLPFDPHTRA